MSAQVRERVSRIKPAPARAQRRRLGLSGGEIAAAAVSLIFLILAVVYYFASLRPEQLRLGNLEEQRKTQQDVILKSQSDLPVGGGSSMDAVKAVVESLDSFRHERLKPESQGIIDLFNQINAIAKKNSLKLISGISMNREETEQREDAKKSEKGRKDKTTKRKTSDQAAGVFPMAQCEFTVFGSYDNVRSFINDLEQSKQFAVIDSMDLKSSEETVQRAERGRRSRAESASGISLSVTMSAYFRP